MNPDRMRSWAAQEAHSSALDSNSIASLWRDCAAQHYCCYSWPRYALYVCHVNCISSISIRSGKDASWLPSQTSSTEGSNRLSDFLTSLTVIYHKNFVNSIKRALCL